MAGSPRRSRHDGSGAGGRGDAGGDRRRQDACRPAPLELSELTELAAEWDAGRSFSEPAGVEWPWAAATRRSQLSSSRGVDLGDAMDTGDDDLQSMLGSLLVRAEVANKETEDFQRAVKSLRSQLARLATQHAPAGVRPPVLAFEVPTTMFSCTHNHSYLRSLIYKLPTWIARCV